MKAVNPGILHLVSNSNLFATISTYFSNLGRRQGGADNEAHENIFNYLLFFNRKNVIIIKWKEWVR